MPALREIQLGFVEAVLSGKFDMPAAWINASDAVAQRRLSIYRNNMLANLCGALREVYPIVDKLVGPAFFNHATQEFIAAHPSTSGDLNDYGGDFATFLAGYAPAAGLSYLPDVARLEWALEKAYHAPDHRPLELQRLNEISADRYDDLRFVLHPAAMLMHSDYPLQTIWEVHQPNYIGDGFVDLDVGGAILLITRRELQTVIESISSAEFIFLSCLQENRPLAVAVSAALEKDEAFSLQTCLTTRIIQGDIIDFNMASVSS